MRAEVKGWCPSAYRPMMSGDGLVVRVRPSFGRLSVEQARGLGALAEQFGNGEIAVTSRLNLQIRGVSQDDFDNLLSGLRVFNLISETAETEAQEHTLLAPIRSGEYADRIAEEVAKGLAGRPALPSKFGIIFDTEPNGRQLADVSGDIRVEKSGAETIVRADGLDKGRIVNDAAEAVLELVDWFQANGVGPDGRGRLRDTSRLLGDEWRQATPDPAIPRLKPGKHESGYVVAGAFGTFPALVFQDAKTDFVPLPNRLLLLEDSETVPEGVISDPHEPLLSVTACVGAPACEQGQVETRELARKLAGKALHVSGCDKGCAFQGVSETTLVGNNGFFDLVKDGRASDTPVKRGLTPEEVIKELGGV